MTTLPDIAPPEAPPGRALHELDHDAQRLALVGLEGLAEQIRARAANCRAGSPAYHNLHDLLGRITTAANVLRRYLAAVEAA